MPRRRLDAVPGPARSAATRATSLAPLRTATAATTANSVAPPKASSLAPSWGECGLLNVARSAKPTTARAAALPARRRSGREETVRGLVGRCTAAYLQARWGSLVTGRRRRRRDVHPAPWPGVRRYTPGPSAAGTVPVRVGRLRPARGPCPAGTPP